ncbi:MAG: tetratricopeptide repeat protein [Pseudomonadota bacterium]
MKRIFALSSILLFFATPAFADGGGGFNNSSKVRDVPEEIVKLVEQQRYERAVSRLKKFTRREKDNADAWNYLGYSYRKTGNLEDSLSAYKKALAIDGEHLGANEYLGELYIMMAQPDDARKQLKKLARICGNCDQFKKLETVINDYENNS